MKETRREECNSWIFKKCRISARVTSFVCEGQRWHFKIWRVLSNFHKCLCCVFALWELIWDFFFLLDSLFHEECFQNCTLLMWKIWIFLWCIENVLPFAWQAIQMLGKLSQRCVKLKYPCVQNSLSWQLQFYEGPVTTLSIHSSSMGGMYKFYCKRWNSCM